MTHTANYHLNQWDAADAVRREDFNADNAAIDAALAGKMGPAELILEASPEEQFSSSFSVDLTGFDWNRWSVVTIEIEPVSGNSSATLSFAIAGANGTLGKNESLTVFRPRTFILFPMRDENRKIRYLFFPGGNICLSNNPYSNITAVQAGTNISTGISSNTVVRMYGIH